MVNKIKEVFLRGLAAGRESGRRHQRRGAGE
jgi:hypothetical protein